MGEWREGKLADVCARIDYGFTASAINAPVGPKFLRITDIVGTSLDWANVPYVEASKADCERFRLYDNDIVIARTGATTGESKFIKNPPNAIFASYLVRLRVNHENDARFLSYWLKSRNFWNYLRGVLGDKSAQPNASASTMTQAPIRIPSDRKAQERVASVLGALDDKIELNRRMNETLEAMARALFRDWFVEFGPTRANVEGRPPYLAPGLWSLFPDRLEGDGKPEGWQRGTLGDALVLQRGFDLPASERVPGPYPVLAASGESGTHNRCMVKGPGVATGRSGLLGRVFYVHRDFWPLNTTLWVKEYRRSGPCHAYFLLESLNFTAFNAGSAVPTLNRNHVHTLKLALPDQQLVDAFEALCSPIQEKVFSSNLESATLAETRDLLLPKLMSGELRVRDADKAVEAAL